MRIHRTPANPFYIIIGTFLSGLDMIGTDACEIRMRYNNEFVITFPSKKEIDKTLNLCQ